MFVNVEDCGHTARSKLTPGKRLKVWEKTGGRCVLCDLPIDGRQRWIAEHIRALELGGADTLANLGPAHESCAKAKTADDHHRAGKARRSKIKLIGAKDPPKRPIQSRGFPKSPPQRTASKPLKRPLPERRP